MIDALIEKTFIRVEKFKPYGRRYADRIKIHCKDKVYVFYTYFTYGIENMEKELSDNDFYQSLSRRNKWNKARKKFFITLLEEWNKNLYQIIDAFKVFANPNGTSNDHQLIELGIAYGLLKSLEIMTYRNTELYQAMEYARILEENYRDEY